MDKKPDNILAPAPRTEPIRIEGRGPVPVTLLTGFLGAGKTTLLNHILNGKHGLRVGVLVNDFGSVNIDAELVEGVEANTINLSNGCVCCEVRDDLVKSLELLLTRERVVDYVVLEASGVSDPGSIVTTFLNPKYEQLLRLDSVTCVVDAEGVFKHGDNQDLNFLKMRQIGFADMVVLNKIDLVGPEHIEVIKEWIDHHLKRVRIVEAVRCEVPMEILIGSGRFEPGNTALAKSGGGAGPQSHKTAKSMFDTWSYESAQAFSLDALRNMVRRDLPASVYRCKGIIFTADSPKKRLALQIVGRRTEITELGEWGCSQPLTQIVAIGEPSEMDAEELRRIFDACIEEI